MAKHQFIVLASSAVKAESRELLRRLEQTQPAKRPLIRTCNSVAKLHAEVGTRRETDWLFLLFEWEAGSLRLGTDTRRPFQLAQEWKAVDLKVWEVVRFGGRVHGRKPAVKTFANLFTVHAGTAVETEWGTHSSFPPP